MLIPRFGMLSERLETVDGHMGLQADAQPEIDSLAHNCILHALNVQGSHFNIEGLQEAICYRDFGAIRTLKD